MVLEGREKRDWTVARKERWSIGGKTEHDVGMGMGMVVGVGVGVVWQGTGDEHTGVATHNGHST
jgi:hypothetical protein